MNEDQIIKQFNSYDENGDGKVTLEEYISACRRNGSTTSDESLTQAFRTFDADGDGEIFLDEFIAAVKFINEQKNL